MPTGPLPTRALWADWQSSSSTDGWTISIRTRTPPVSPLASDYASCEQSMASPRTTSDAWSAARESPDQPRSCALPVAWTCSPERYWMSWALAFPTRTQRSRRSSAAAPGTEPDRAASASPSHVCATPPSVAQRVHERTLNREDAPLPATRRRRGWSRLSRSTSTGGTSTSRSSRRQRSVTRVRRPGSLDIERETIPSSLDPSRVDLPAALADF